MADAALLTGLAQGLQQGLLSYQDAEDRKRKREVDEQNRQQQQLQLKVQLATHDRQINPQTGEVEYTEAGKKKMELDAAEKALALEGKAYQGLGGDAVGVEGYSDYLNRTKNLSNRITGSKPQGLVPEQSGISVPAQSGEMQGQPISTAGAVSPPPKQSNSIFRADYEPKEVRKRRERNEDELAKEGRTDARKRQHEVDFPSKERSQAGAFATRLDDAESVFQDLAAKGFDRASNKSSMQAAAANSNIMGVNVGSIAKGAGLIDPQVLQQDQAERNFVNAVLRKESGAAISQSEFDNAEKQYFPRAGDSDEVKSQKTRNRAVARAALRAEAGAGLLSNIQKQLPKTENVKPKGPKVGEVIDGHRFKGGDPAKQSNWEKVS